MSPRQSNEGAAEQGGGRSSSRPGRSRGRKRSGKGRCVCQPRTSTRPCCRTPTAPSSGSRPVTRPTSWAAASGPPHRSGPEGLRRGHQCASPEIRRLFRNCRSWEAVQAGLFYGDHIIETAPQGCSRRAAIDDDDLLIVDDNEYGTAQSDAAGDFTVNALFLDPAATRSLTTSGSADLERRSSDHRGPGVR